MKAISQILAILIIIIISIIITAVGSTVIFSIAQDSSDDTKQSAKDLIHDKTINLRIESATSNSLKIRNLGTSSVNYNEIYVLDSNNNEINFSGEGNIETKSTKVLEFSTALEKGSYKLVTPLIDVPFKVEGDSTEDMMQDVIQEPDPEFEPDCGTSQNPCKIYNETQLNSIRNKNLNFHYILMSDIDLSGFDDDGNPDNGNWIPVGTISSFFTGNFNGNGYVISNIDVKEGVGVMVIDGVQRPAYVGFFGAITGTAEKYRI